MNYINEHKTHLDTLKTRAATTSEALEKKRQSLLNDQIVYANMCEMHASLVTLINDATAKFEADIKAATLNTDEPFGEILFYGEGLLICNSEETGLMFISIDDYDPQRGFPIETYQNCIVSYKNQMHKGHLVKDQAKLELLAGTINYTSV